MEKVDVELSREVLDAIDAEAEDGDKTRSKVASEMLDEWLDRRELST